MKSMSNSLLPVPRASKRIMVSIQPGMEVIVVASPNLMDTAAFAKPDPILGRIVMNSKRALWFVLPNGDRVHLAKSPDGKQRNSKRKP